MFHRIAQEKKKPRRYQVEGVERALESHKSAVNGTIIIGPPGIGKSYIMAMLANKLREFGGVLILADRRELVNDNAREVERLTGQECPVEMEASRVDMATWMDVKRGGDNTSGIVSASVSTMQGARLSRIPSDAIRHIIVDECDLVKPGGKYDKVRYHFRDRPWFGATATPIRKGAGKSNGLIPRVFDKIVNLGTLFDFQEAGWLVDFKVQHVSAVAELIDFSKLRNLKNNIITDAVAAEVWKANEMESTLRIRNALFTYAPDMPTVVFAGGVQHAKLVAEACNVKQAGVADYIASYLINDDGTQSPYPQEKRNDVIAAMKAGRLRYLTNQNVISRGTNIPNISCVAFARTIQSERFYQQGAGRGGRVAEGVLNGLEEAMPWVRKEAIAKSAKPWCTLLDMVGVTSECQLVGPANLITDPDWTAEKRQLATQVIREESAKGNSISLQEIKAVVEHKVSDWMRAIRTMLQHTIHSVEWELTEFNPRETQEPQKKYTKPTQTNVAAPPSEAAINYYMTLQKQTVKEDKRYTKEQVYAKGAKWVGFWIGKLRDQRDAMPTEGWLRRKLALAGATVPAKMGEALQLHNKLKGEGK